MCTYTHKYTHTHIHTHGDREARASGSLSSAAMRTMRVRVRTNERGEVDGCDHEEGAEFVELPRNPAPVSGFCVCAVGRAIQPIEQERKLTAGLPYQCAEVARLEQLGPHEHDEQKHQGAHGQRNLRENTREEPPASAGDPKRTRSPRARARCGRAELGAPARQRACGWCTPPASRQVPEFAAHADLEAGEQNDDREVRRDGLEQRVQQHVHEQHHQHGDGREAVATPIAVLVTRRHGSKSAHLRKRQRMRFLSPKFHPPAVFRMSGKNKKSQPLVA